jgi:hypothetical protein
MYPAHSRFSVLTRPKLYSLYRIVLNHTGGITLTKLRQRTIEDMQLRDLAEKT